MVVAGSTSIEHGIAELEDAHVRQHSPLRIQQGRVAAGAWGQCRDVVGEEPLKVGAPIRAGEQHRPRAEPIDESRLLPERPVLFG